MTGFSSKAVSIDAPKAGKVSLSIEMKTINSRFFEMVCKLPGALNSLEVKIQRLLQKKLRRGRLYLSVRFAEDNEAFESINPSLKHAEGYLKAAEQIKNAFGVKGELEITDLLQMPSMFVSTRTELDPGDEKQILAVVETVADLLLQARREEGDQLYNDLLKRFALCKEKMNEVKKLSDSLMDSIKKSIDEKLALAEGGDEVAKLQLEDLYAALNKADVHEEITRFNSHLQGVDALFKSDKVEKGKRLDFMLQELLRETNTTMAKCSNFDISSVCVDIKVELEKAREQTQNIV